jgi:outer membrane protein
MKAGNPLRFAHQRPLPCRVLAAVAGFVVIALAVPVRAQDERGGTLSSSATSFSTTTSSSTAPLSDTSASPDTLSLRQAITLALQNNRDMKVARMQYMVAQNEVGVDRAAFLPNLYTGSGAAYTNGFPSVGGQAPAAFQVNYNEVLFNPLLKGDQHAAEEHAKNQKLEMDRVHDDVEVRTATAYLELAKVRHSLELMRSEQASGEKILEVVKERVEANQELPIEVTRQQLSGAVIQERVVELEDRDQALTDQLRDLTGLPDDRSIEVATEDSALTANLSSALSDSELVNMAIQNDRSILESANDRAARAELLHGAKWSYFPTVSLVAQYSLLTKSNGYLDFYKSFDRNNVAVGVQVTIPIFSAKTHANLVLARSELSLADLNLGAKRQQVRVEVQEKARNVRELDAKREVARLDLQLAREGLGISQAKFDQGHATLQEIEQARLDESEKWVAFLDADFARQQAQLVLLEATGQLAKVFQ